MKQTAKYSYDAENIFVVDNYNWAKPFSGFFPGIAGKYGIPLWAYYVSRGQAVCSLGSKDKDGAILEFLSFNRACQMVGNQGFRTFLRLDDGSVYEPFRKVRDTGIHQKLKVQSHELSVEEWNEELDLEIQVTYFPLVQAPVGGLIRHLCITNGKSHNVDLQLLDGVPRVLPYGVSFENVKVISRHIEGMMGVDIQGGIPRFRLNQTAEDHAEVGHLEGSNFYASMLDGEHFLRGNYIIDPEVIFGTPYDFSTPWSFEENSIDELLFSQQVMENRTPCAFTPTRATIPAGESFSLYSILGYISKDQYLERFFEKIVDEEYFQEKRIENKEVIDEIRNIAFSVSSQPLLDQYCQETFLENVMRGGMPTFFNQEQETNPFYTYARQNGDLERDYHWFVLEPTYLSQGNGHYRSICQNRRMDTWFFPRVQAHNIKMFMNLIQLDGYNPLIINGQRYIGTDEKCIKDYFVSNFSANTPIDDLTKLILKPFTPGEVILWLEELQGDIQVPYNTLLEGLLPLCREMEVGDIHAGFWIDHWLYNLDLIDQFLLVYPDRLKKVIWDDWSYTFYDNPDVVVPRRDKFALNEGKVRQFNAVQRDLEKESMLAARRTEKNKVRSDNGLGEVFRTNFFVKLLCVLANKIAVMDPAGVGVEMEADKPGWNDSLNGLPGLMGSSICQTLEMLRAFRFMSDCLSKIPSELNDLPVFQELAVFMRGLMGLLEKNDGKDPQIFWDHSHQLLDNYRSKTRLGIQGTIQPIEISEVAGFITAGLNFLERIFSKKNSHRIFDEKGVPITYFTNEMGGIKESVSEKIPAPHPSEQSILPKGYKQRPLSLFLEGPVHYLKLFPRESQEVYKAVRESNLFDPELQMYKVCESLENESHELGRIRSYPRGWIENESVYTHMEYKWLLEILRSGLIETFFEEIKTLLPPFMSPEVYGRSTVENSSFIVSSAYPDANLHGQAFQPRLSGVTAEWLEIWTIMVAGTRPFRLDSRGRLQLTLEPLLPDWLFTEQDRVAKYWDRRRGWEEVIVPANCFAFRFLGQVLVIYHNPDRRATFGSNPGTISSSVFTQNDGSVLKEEGNIFSEQSALAVRSGCVRKMDITLE